MRATHTYVTMEVSESTYFEIFGLLRDAGYNHCYLHENYAGEIPLLLMQGIALKMDKAGMENSE